jgi:predicted dehydrogenase
MTVSRRNFLRTSVLGTAGLAVSGSTLGMSVRSYNRIKGANERLQVAIAGLGRRLEAYYQPVGLASSNVELLYLCDVMKRQRESGLQKFSKHISYKPRLENDIRKVLADKDVDVLINATPDHWHAPGTWLAVQAGKHVYVEKPCSHNPREGEILAMLPQRYGKIIQMGNQQRSAAESIDIIGQIHGGAIGQPYKAVAFYVANRGEVPVPKAAPVPDGLDWELFQGPAPRKPYQHDTWDYNWHWYGWDYGTAESGNNGTHELDVARWALQVGHPRQVRVEAAKRHFANDGWTMYDTMDASFHYADDKVITWECQCRNGYPTHGSGRGTIVYGTNGSAYIDRDGYKLYSREGKLLKTSKSQGTEAGTALGGGGDMTTRHVVNFFEAIRGKEKQNSPIEEGAKSVLLCHLANIAYRTNSDLTVDETNGRIRDKKAMKLWSRDYEKGWEPPF